VIPADVLLLFVTASVALAFAPGPDNIFVLTQSALHGRKKGLLVTLGLCTGLLLHTAAVALGVAAIFQTSMLAFNLLKLVGALYLLYLAAQAFRSSAAALKTNASEAFSWRELYTRGIIMNITNPKVAIFFLAFLPQFADPARASIAVQILQLGGVFIASTLIVFGAVAWFAGYVGEWLQRSARAQLMMNRIAGMVFVALALRLALSER
jgi:threonine/homoserine/homoserine lactone efflux protein